MTGLYKQFFIIVAAVLLVFALIVSFTGIVGTYFGKTAEMILLGIAAAVLLVMFIQTRRSISEDRRQEENGESEEEIPDDTDPDRSEE